MVGKRISEYLTDHGIKQGFIADKAGIPHSQMSEICKKGRTIDCMTYYKICKALNVPLETFLVEE